MAAVTCTAAGFAEAAACWTSPNFNSKEQLSILAYIMWKMGDSVDQTVTTIDEQIDGARCIAASISDEKLMGSLIAVLNRGITAAQGIAFIETVTALTTATASEAIKCLKNIPENQLRAIVVWNICRIMSDVA